MKLAFFQPPAPQRIGGLDAAIQGMNAALAQSGVSILESPATDASFDVAHFHGLWQPAHARLARELSARGLPYIVSPHGMLEPWAWRHKWWKKWPYFQLVEKRHLAGAAALLATGRGEAERLARFAPRQTIESLPLGLTAPTAPGYDAARRDLGWAPEEVVLLYLSRLHQKKGADLLLRALARIRCPAVARLVVVGDGERAYVDSLHTFAHQHAGTLPRIDWVGAVWGEARWKYFQGADLFVLPTHSENFGLAVLESLQVGTPALTTCETPWADVIRPSRGMIIRPTLDDLSRALTDFFQSPRTPREARQQIADWAHAHYAWSQLGPRYAAFFQRLAARPRRSTAGAGPSVC